MTRFILSVIAFFALSISAAHASEFSAASMGNLPILHEGRVKPIDTFARATLKEIYGRDVAHEVHQALKKSGGVKIPREFVFMDRAALGLGSVFLHLKAEINWHQIFNELIADFDVKELDKRQKMALKKFDIPV